MNKEETKTIPIELNRSNGTRIRLLKRHMGLALYINLSDGYFSGYEVHKVQRQTARTCTIKGKTFHQKAGERIAKDSEFGKYAWAIPNLQEAISMAKCNTFSNEIEEMVKNVR